MNVVFIGHVDAGKSTLGGQLLYLTGMVDKRTMEKYEREAKDAGRETWYLSWALDSTTQERSKVFRIDDSHLYFHLSEKTFVHMDRVKQWKSDEHILRPIRAGSPYWMHRVTSHMSHP